MKYQCCECKGEFPATEAIDGFKQGYKVGFLCPLCGENIQDNPLKTHAVFSNKGDGKYYGLGFIMAILSYLFLTIIENEYWPHYLAIGLIFLVYIVYGHFRHPLALYSPTMSTQKVKNV